MCLNDCNSEKADYTVHEGNRLIYQVFENPSWSTHRQDADAPKNATPTVLSEVTWSFMANARFDQNAGRKIKYPDSWVDNVGPNALWRMID